MGRASTCGPRSRRLTTHVSRARLTMVLVLSPRPHLPSVACGSAYRSWWGSCSCPGRPSAPTARRERAPWRTGSPRSAARTCASTGPTRWTGTRGARRRSERARTTGEAHLPLGGLRRVPLVPRHGARVLRGRGHREDPERRLRVREGRPRGAARPRPRLHDGGPGDLGARRLADDRAAHARRAPVPRADVSTRARSSTTWCGR